MFIKSPYMVLVLFQKILQPQTKFMNLAVKAHFRVWTINFIISLQNATKVNANQHQYVCVCVCARLYSLILFGGNLNVFLLLQNKDGSVTGQPTTFVCSCTQTHWRWRWWWRSTARACRPEPQNHRTTEPLTVKVKAFKKHVILLIS